MNMNDYPEYKIDIYNFCFNHIQGIINIEIADEFLDCIELGAGTTLTELDFKEKCHEWEELNRERKGL